tara:strand:+ start:164 stop:1744 length:1581 start_codon:yes stop_codon:yes gene_type:complete
MAKTLFDINGQQSGFSYNSDLSPYDMPPTNFTNVENVRFVDKKASTILGYTRVFGTALDLPYWVTSWAQGSNNLWVYGGPTSLNKINGATHTNITRASGAYTTLTGTVNNWQGGVLGGVLVANNTLDVPQSITQGGSVFTDLPDWPSTLRCKAIVPFRNHLIAMNLTDSGTAKPFTVRWSDAIPSGAATNGANTWNTGSTASESGEATIGGTKGVILNALPLGNELLIYKEDSIHSLNYVGGTFTFNLREKFKDVGLFSRDAVVDIGDGRHVFMSTNDVVVTNGQSVVSIVDDKVKTFLFSQIDSTYYYKTFMVNNRIQNEIWICYPQTNATNGLPNRALVWNYKDNTWSIRDLPSVNYIGRGFVDPDLTNTWSAATNTWENSTLAWTQQLYNPSIDSLLMCFPSDSAANSRFFLADSGTTFAGATFVTTLERIGLHAGRTDSIKAVSRIYPRISGTGYVKISVGAELEPYAGVTYADPVEFNIGVDSKIDCRVRGRYIAIKFEHDTDTSFSLSGYAIESEVVSDR